MQKTGKITRWDSARGFGFIRSPDTTADVFFHARDFRHAGQPAAGMSVAFEEIHVGGKGPRAMAVRPAAPQANPPRHDAGRARRTSRQQPSVPRSRTAPSAPPSGSAPVFFMLLSSWSSLLIWGTWTQRLPLWLLGMLLLWNLATFYIYWSDKYAAQKSQWRIRERTLHLFGLLGGWPGAWFAHQILRHKSRKADFRADYWATVMLHGGALIAWLFWAQPQLMR